MELLYWWARIDVAPRKKAFDSKKQVRALARERVGIVPSSKPIEPKNRRKRPKHKKWDTDEDKSVEE